MEEAWAVCPGQVTLACEGFGQGSECIRSSDLHASWLPIGLYYRDLLDICTRSSPESVFLGR